MIDTDKYEGHTVNRRDKLGTFAGTDIYVWTYFAEELPSWTSKADFLLVEDAPLLLAEVKRLKEIIGMFDEFICNNWMPSNSYPYAPSPFDNVHSLWNELLWRAEEE